MGRFERTFAMDWSRSDTGNTKSRFSGFSRQAEYNTAPRSRFATRGYWDALQTTSVDPDYQEQTDGLDMPIASFETDHDDPREHIQLFPERPLLVLPHTLDLIPRITPEAGNLVNSAITDPHFHDQIGIYADLFRDNSSHAEFLSLSQQLSGYLFEYMAIRHIDTTRKDSILPPDDVQALYDRPYMLNKYADVRTTTPDLLMFREFDGTTYITGAAELTCQTLLYDKYWQTEKPRPKISQLQALDTAQVIEQLYTDPTHTDEWTEYIRNTIKEHFPELPDNLSFDPRRYEPLLVLPKRDKEERTPQFKNRNGRTLRIPISRFELKRLHKALVKDFAGKELKNDDTVSTWAYDAAAGDD